MEKINQGFVSQSDVLLLDGLFKTSQEVGERYLHALDIDRFLAPCYEAHGLAPKQPRYEGWEARTISGHSLGHYMSALAVTYQATGHEALKAKLDYAVSELAGIQAATGSGYVGGLVETPFIEAFKGTDIGGFSMNGYWVPWYSVHKIYQGLIDAFTLTGNEEALHVVKAFADWAVNGLSQMSEEQTQHMLECEHGGMNEVFAQLYGLTGQAVYMEAAVQFTHKAIISPLEQERDELQGKHANTQIPKVIGVAEMYEQNKDFTTYRTAAEFFWHTVVGRRSYVFGGSSLSEHFEAMDMESLGIKSAESCFTHNMLVLTQYLFSWEQNSAYMDYYENALYNHILGTQDPHTGNKTYFASTLPGHFKIYGTRDSAWWCCTGTGMENPGKYAEAIYFEKQDDLYVNLYMASELEWKAKGLVIRQETSFPYSDTVKLVIAEGTAEANLKLRVPSWLPCELVAVVNGERKYVEKQAGYLTISGTWSKGDHIIVTLPLALRKYTAKDSASKIAFLYGPIVLAGRFGADGLPEDTIVDETALSMKTADVPVLWTESENLSDFIRLKDAETLTFEIAKEVTSDGKGAALVPFYALHHEFYTLYWNLNDEGDAFEKKLNKVTIDSVQPDGQQDEIGHQLQGNCLTSPYNGSFTDNQNKLHMWREAFGVSDAYFSYRLAVDGSNKNNLCVAYWGGDHFRFEHEGTAYNREFEVLVDDEIVGEQTIHCNKIGHIFYVTYEIAEPLTRGKASVIVTFKAKSPASCAGRVAGVRTTSAIVSP
ncbi:beta-L-arabinofuranosidase domain-containing protein [Paenibacillus sp. Leaf72]|uniref:beta-L-arabinofuranosidase domain-containing protein n=1 Tax=Paenibacillus sp. Leaf72 TaxID=1736234 RepID=UPI0006F1D0CB|nr:beta-L-arabinofuranosidase domain-containing protein [Paenibacillus sp. Leaf72]KQO10733.1 glycosyl hydrolase [Paenibacillus sp. Leaf72]